VFDAVEMMASVARLYNRTLNMPGGIELKCRGTDPHISAGQRAYEVIRSFRQALSALETVVAGECWGNF
jgi:hypothetical protein